MHANGRITASVRALGTGQREQQNELDTVFSHFALEPQQARSERSNFISVKVLMVSKVETGIEVTLLHLPH